MKMIIKNQIRSTSMVLIISLSIGIFMQSCENDDITSFQSLSSVEEVNLKAAEYLELCGNQYVLNLSEETAFALGISKFDYDRIQKEIFVGNALILECQAKGGQIVLNDPRKSQINFSNIRLKNDGEQTQEKNKFDTNLGETHGSSAWAPMGVTKIEISVTGPCPATIVSGTISSFGQDIPYTVGGVSGGTGTYDLPASNVSVRVNGTTNCSGGASVSFAFK